MAATTVACEKKGHRNPFHRQSGSPSQEMGPFKMSDLLGKCHHSHLNFLHIFSATKQIQDPSQKTHFKTQTKKPKQNKTKTSLTSARKWIARKRKAQIRLLSDKKKMTVMAATTVACETRHKRSHRLSHPGCPAKKRTFPGPDLLWKRHHSLLCCPYEQRESAVDFPENQDSLWCTCTHVYEKPFSEVPNISYQSSPRTGYKFFLKHMMLFGNLIMICRQRSCFPAWLKNRGFRVREI